MGLIAAAATYSWMSYPPCVRVRSARRRPVSTTTAMCRRQLDHRQQQQRQRRVFQGQEHLQPRAGALFLLPRASCAIPRAPRARYQRAAGRRTRTSASCSAVSDLESSELDLTGKTVVVVGLGKSGRSAARLALARGADVIGVDRNLDCTPLEGDPTVELRDGDDDDDERGRTGGGGGAGIEGGAAVGRILRTELGPHDDATFAAADIVVLSPGVPLTQPQVAAALRASSGVKKNYANENGNGNGNGNRNGSGGTGGGGGGGFIVTSELAFASQCLPTTLPIAAVTGTNGKSTVCTFVGQLLESCGARVFVGGNLGTPLSDCALTFVAAARRGRRLGQTGCHDGDGGTWLYDAAVVECSSYQLEHPGVLRFDAACVINLTPDHMERHGSMEVYAGAKARIFAALTGPGKLAVLPARGVARAGGGGGGGGTSGGRPSSTTTSSSSAYSSSLNSEEVEGGGGEAAEAAEAVDWNDVGAALLERGRDAVIKESTTTQPRRHGTDDADADDDDDADADGGGGLDVAAVGGVLARIGSLPGVVVDPSARTATVQLPGRPENGGMIAGCRDYDHEATAVDLTPLTAVGAHNANNAGVALLLAHALDPVRFPVARLAQGLASLTPPPHRMQLVAHTGGEDLTGGGGGGSGDTGGIQWVDDSKATNVEAAAAGLGGYDRRAVVLLGGMAKEGVGPGGKGLGFAALVPVLRRHQGVVTFGGSGAAIARELRAAGLEPSAEVSTMLEAGGG